ncbi:MAG: HD domain-containing protein, partial [Planctomycetes bacterium]|nr:HD domain-containing protein [Planctomycetota bacterium]
IFDVGLQLGHSVRTASEAVQLAREDVIICTSLIDARMVIGNQALLETFRSNFEKMIRRNAKSLCRNFLDARTIERDQYGQTLYLLEPHVKRSRGGLRDMNLLGWLGFVEHGESDPDRLRLMGAISKLDHRRWLSARLFLLRLRNEMHFFSGSSRDMLDRAEQLRIADWMGLSQRAGLLPVEHFMRDYFRYTNHLWQMVRRRHASFHVASRVARVLDPVLGKNITGDYRVGLSHLSATPQGMTKLKKDIREVLRLVELSAREGKHLDHRTFSALLLAAPEFPEQVSSEVAAQFYDLLAKPAEVGEIVRLLHELGYLEKIIPAFRHVRFLLQFNQYHKYTVDEHSLRAVRKGADFADRPDALGQAYRDIEDKRILHLALLLHDLGKGYEEDHSEVGKRIAEKTTAMLGLDSQTADDVVFLVHQHLTMSHLAFRRDTSDVKLLSNFANDVGSTDRLRMLFVLSCADLDAVGPGVLNDWKIDVLADVFARSSKLLQKGGSSTYDSKLETHRHEILQHLTPEERADDWFKKQLAVLSAAYLAASDVEDVLGLLRRFHNLEESAAHVTCTAQPETKTLQFTAGVDQGVGRGVFSGMAGALSSQGMQILAASTDVLDDNLLMLRYQVADLLDRESTPAERQEALCRLLVDSIATDEPPQFRNVWGEEAAEAKIQLSALPNEVRIDNRLSANFTIIEVFTFDRKGLLYLLARKLHDLETIIRHAKIATSLDQVVDVFYLTDREGKKITDQPQLDELSNQLMEVIDRE